ncbi:hypothetical protein [Winogradskyella aquimaris]|uniref:SMODS and SLOG-associating 2TM effector domain-containing protein n=1 Tax=Winogradskyella aquimaris TaxID=864074 RepID=A0ABU5EQS5_9FLAO|nr:hypothetical protein [Winogradskyella aquimaris]MDY2588514.1 hypothetical protein [Winogradskyella aquimaris]
MNEIKQRKGFETRSYKIDSDSEFVEVEYNSIKDKLKYKIHLTEVGNEIQYEADNIIVGKIFVGITSIITLICVGVYFLGNPEKPGTYVANAIIWGVLSIFGFLKPHKDDILIANGNKLIRLFRTKPNEEKVTEFAKNLIKIANNKKKEMLINFDLEEEQFMGNMQWLMNMKLIDKSELEELKSEYKLKKLI